MIPTRVFTAQLDREPSAEVPSRFKAVHQSPMCSKVFNTTWDTTKATLATARDELTHMMTDSSKSADSWKKDLVEVAVIMKDAGAQESIAKRMIDPGQ